MDYRVLQGVTGVYKGLLRVAMGYRGLQGVTEGYNGFQGVTMGYKGLQGFTRGYRGFHSMYSVMAAARVRRYAALTRCAVIGRWIFDKNSSSINEL